MFMDTATARETWPVAGGAPGVPALGLTSTGIWLSWPGAGRGLAVDSGLDVEPALVRLDAADAAPGKATLPHAVTSSAHSAAATPGSAMAQWRARVWRAASIDGR
jgi:hypothetical protein